MAENRTSLNASEAAIALNNGDIIAFPTETVFGLGVDAANPAAIAKIYDLKGRDEQKPLQILLPDASWIEKLAITTPASKVIADKLMPGPLTMVLERKNTEWVDESTALGQQTVGLRVPDFKETESLLKTFNKPIAATSANLSGENPANSRDEVMAAFGDSVAIVGQKSGGYAPSTVIKCTEEGYVILREGEIAAMDIDVALA